MSSLSLDLQTLSVSFMLVASFLSFLMIYIWRVHKTYPGFDLWVISNFMGVAGFLLLSLRGAIPDFLTIVVANTLVMGGILLAFEGNRRFLGLKSSRVFCIALLAAQVILLTIFTYLDNSIPHRISIISVFAAIVAARTAFIFNRHAPPEDFFTYRFTGATYLAFAVVMVLRLIFTNLSSNIIDFYEPNWVQSLSYMTFIAFIIMWTFNHMILNNQRLQNDLKATQRELEKLAATDFLTGVNNKRRFLEISEIEISRARRFRHSLAVIMFDIDHFKNINDSFGHAGGDEVLVKIVEICKRELRSVDVAGRIGGEEFAILLPHTEITGAQTVAEHLRAAIVEMEIEAAAEKIKVTASFGVTAVHAADREIKQALDRADVALYKAKRGGRNQVVAECPETASNLLAVA